MTAANGLLCRRYHLESEIASLGHIRDQTQATTKTFDMPDEPRQQADAVPAESGPLPRITPSRLPLIAAVLGACAFATALVAFFICERVSRNAQVDAMAQQNLRIAQLIGQQLEDSSTVDTDIASQAAAIWKRFDDSTRSLAIVRADGDRLFDTQNEESDVDVVAQKREPKSWSGTEDGGERIAGYYFSPELESFVAVYTSKEVYRSQIQQSMWPWLIGFGLSGLILWPLLWGAMNIACRRHLDHVFHVETALRKRARAQDRLANVVGSFPDAIVSCTPDRKIDSWNAGARELLGFRRDEALGRDVFDFLPQDQYSEFEGLGQLLQRGESVREMETTCLTKGDRRIDISLTVAPIFNSSKMIVGAVSVIRDLADRREAERQQRLLKRALDSASNGVMIIDVTGPGHRVTYVNPAYERITGYSSEEVVGELYELLESSSHEPGLIQVQNAVLRSKEVQVVIEDRRKDGTHFWNELYFAPIRDTDNHVTHYVCVLQDVSDRKHAEDQLRLSEQRLRYTMDMLPDMIWVSDETKACTYFNKTWLEFTGRTLEQESGNGWVQGVHPDDLDRCFSTYSNAFDARDRFEMEYRLRRHDGRFRTILDVGVPWYEPDGRFIGYIGSCVDVTERKATETALRQRDIELAHVSRLSTLGEMVASIAHEINQPLYAISNFAQTCLHSLDADRATKEQLMQWNTSIHEQATRAGAIIRRMRDFLKKGTTTREVVDVNQLVLETVEMMEFEFRQGQIQVQTHLVEPTTHVMANRVELQQVTVNLIRNAVEALAANTTPRRIEIRTERENGHAIVTVADNGPGLNEDVCDKLTEPFFSTKPDGMGMGLAISRTIIDAHEGELHFDQASGVGARVSFEVPTTNESATR